MIWIRSTYYITEFDDLTSENHVLVRLLATTESLATIPGCNRYAENFSNS